MKPLAIAERMKLVWGILKEFPALRARPYWEPQKTQAYQLRHLRARLSDAQSGVPLYRHRGLPSIESIQTLKDWNQVPLLKKSDLLSAAESDRIHRDYTIEDLIVSKSSGSTGQALNVFYDPKSFVTFILAGLRLYQMAFRYLPWHRQTYIYTSAYPMDSLFGMFPMRFLSTLTPIDETLKDLRNHPPDLLVCYPSHLRALVSKMTDEDFRLIRPKAVNVNSEMSTAKEREFLSHKLGAFVFDDYSSEELTRIAAQCRHLQYHLFEDINYMEVVDDQGTPVPDGTVGNLVGTNLLNKGMPLLRYMQGDRGAIRTAHCECGWNFRVLEKLEGRKNDSFLCPDGSELSSGFLLDLTYGVFLGYEGAAQAFCLIQHTPQEWVLEIVPGSHWNTTVEAQILADFKREIRQPQVVLTIQKVAQVTRTASGKSNPIISRIKRN